MALTNDIALARKIQQLRKQLQEASWLLGFENQSPFYLARSRVASERSEEIVAREIAARSRVRSLRAQVAAASSQLRRLSDQAISDLFEAIGGEDEFTQDFLQYIKGIVKDKKPYSQVRPSRYADLFELFSDESPGYTRSRNQLQALARQLEAGKIREEDFINESEQIFRRVFLRDVKAAASRRETLLSILTNQDLGFFADTRALYLQSPAIRDILETEISARSAPVEASKKKIEGFTSEILKLQAESVGYSSVTEYGQAERKGRTQAIQGLYDQLNKEREILYTAQKRLRDVIYVEPGVKNILRIEDQIIPLEGEFGDKVKVVLEEDVLSKIDPGGFIPGISEVREAKTQRENIAGSIKELRAALARTSDPEERLRLQDAVKNLEIIDRPLLQKHLAETNRQRLFVDKRFARLITSGVVQKDAEFLLGQGGTTTAGLEGQRVRVTETFLDESKKGAFLSEVLRTAGEDDQIPVRLSVEVTAENLVRDEIMRRQIRFSADPPTFAEINHETLGALRQLAIENIEQEQNQVVGGTFDEQLKKVGAALEGLFPSGASTPFQASTETLSEKVLNPLRDVLYSFFYYGERRYAGGISAEAPFEATTAKVAQNLVAALLYPSNAADNFTTKQAARIIRHLAGTQDPMLTDAERQIKTLLQQANIFTESNIGVMQGSQVKPMIDAVRKQIKTHYGTIFYDVPLYRGELEEAARKEAWLFSQQDFSSEQAERTPDKIFAEPAQQAPRNADLEVLGKQLKTTEEYLEELKDDFLEELENELNDDSLRSPIISKDTYRKAIRTIAERIEDMKIEISEEVGITRERFLADLPKLVEEMGGKGLEEDTQQLLDHMRRFYLVTNEELENSRPFFRHVIQQFFYPDIDLDPFVGTIQDIQRNFEFLKARQMTLRMQLPAMPGFEGYEELGDVSSPKMVAAEVNRVLSAEGTVKGERYPRFAISVSAREKQDRLRSYIFYNYQRLEDQARQLLGEAATDQQIKNKIFEIARQEFNASPLSGGVTFEMRFRSLTQMAAQLTEEQLRAREASLLEAIYNEIKNRVNDEYLRTQETRGTIKLPSSSGEPVDFFFENVPITKGQVFDFLEKNPGVQEELAERGASFLRTLPSEIFIAEPVLQGEEIGLLRGVASVGQLEAAAVLAPNTVNVSRHARNLATIEDMQQKTLLDLLQETSSFSATGDYEKIAINLPVKGLEAKTIEELRDIAQKLGVQEIFAGKSVARPTAKEIAAAIEYTLDQRLDTLQDLTRKDLLETARAFGITGVTSKNKQTIIDTIMARQTASLESRLMTAFEEVGLNFEKVKELSARFGSGLRIGTDKAIGESIIDDIMRSGASFGILPELKGGTKIYSPFDLAREVKFFGVDNVGGRLSVRDIVRAMVMRTSLDSVDPTTGQQTSLSAESAFARIVKDYFDSIFGSQEVIRVLQGTEQGRNLLKTFEEISQASRPTQLLDDAGRIIQNGAEEVFSPGEAFREHVSKLRSGSGAAAEAVATGGMRPASVPTVRQMLADVAELMRSNRPVRYGAYGVGAVVAAGLVKAGLGSNKEDMTEEELMGPPNLPGGNPYSGVLSPGQSYTAMGLPGYQSMGASFQDGGVTYQINARGNYDPAVLQSEIEAITQSRMGGTISRGIINPQIDYEDIAGDF